MDPYPAADVSVASAGAYLSSLELAMQGAIWAEVEANGGARLDGSRASMPVPGPDGDLNAKVQHLVLRLFALPR